MEHRVCQAEVRGTFAVSLPSRPTRQGILSAAKFGLDETTRDSHEIIYQSVSGQIDQIMPRFGS
jgi:hypothetical protein